ncbi:hypothetical protein A9Q84_20670 [Halobacteriovorax marinus]|uniref:Helix-turn-helix domain-containing protein n=1 Tax=Halobacteriovorax marinus TaxID=97084 RepID=A0A1Y5F1Y1_9BACT|nr:hypothetical protein A9Q84_20670 [Halobacteriovorax marinus]
MEDNGIWLSILEYAQLRDLSISTVRRYIKAERVKFKKENGKFLISISTENYMRNKQNSASTEGETLKLKFRVQELELQVKTIKLENDELKMLVNLYENNKVENNILPAIPLEL